jgi:phosphatidylglycerophosphatase A
VPIGWDWAVAGFVLFRLFDILKPWPIHWIDRRVGGGLGIMADDVLAGLYAAAMLHATAWWLGV